MNRPPYRATRSIPACAGETRKVRPNVLASGVYPRVCGGNQLPLGHHPTAQGLSPRVRGKLVYHSKIYYGTRSIPACAGETWYKHRDWVDVEVYPRVCGGNLLFGGHRRKAQGLSPRVRGKHGVGAAGGGTTRSIPACAGETCPAGIAILAQTVYPRVCGGNAEPAPARIHKRGLSPRVRGKLLYSAARRHLTRSIPACAGETGQLIHPALTSLVYPRVCGGNRYIRPERRAWGGLSPRVRGKRLLPNTRSALMRSIPACAGETLRMATFLPAIGVYPRVCGGNLSTPMARWSLGGLSPRVRGKLPVVRNFTSISGSIPACAGETRICWVCRQCYEVYPRVCGGNSRSSLARSRPVGLSPRVRGKQMEEGDVRMLQGSIPACAGETPWTPWTPWTPEVYPRVCGGNPAAYPIGILSQGLSPRVRGKRLIALLVQDTQGSIPACAGETKRALSRGRVKRVYPRVCGGNRTDVAASGRLQGLSPRVRGKLISRPLVGDIPRSIPACAGETGR